MTGAANEGRGANAGRSVAIVGGGIAGLTAAIAFARHGADVTLYEQAPEFTEVGAGLQVSPNGARVIDAIGLGPALDAVSIHALAVEPMDGLTGRQITRFDLSGRSGPPYRFVHRAALIDVLAAGAREAGATLITDARTEVAPEADIVVAADGLHSVFRAQLNGASEPFFTGQVAWRAMVERVPVAEVGPVARVWMAPGQHIVTYPLPGDRLNIVAVQERQEWRAEGWHHDADPLILRRAFQGFSGRVTGWLEHVERVMEWGLFRHPVAEKWTDGQRLAVIGDAAHPTLPFLAQGANLAMEDAWVLAATLDEGPLAERLPAFQARRRPRAVRAIAAANANAVNYHRSGVMRSASHLVLGGIGRLAPDWWLGRLSWLYDHDVTAG